MLPPIMEFLTQVVLDFVLLKESSAIEKSINDNVNIEKQGNNEVITDGEINRERLE